eukprot:COSAG01_NODE_45161_length_412_cov_0.555911_1_plen_24_part_10
MERVVQYLRCARKAVTEVRPTSIL